jgi:hypothetical protein
VRRRGWRGRGGEGGEENYLVTLSYLLAKNLRMIFYDINLFCNLLLYLLSSLFSPSLPLFSSCSPLFFSSILAKLHFFFPLSFPSLSPLFPLRTIKIFFLARKISNHIFPRKVGPNSNDCRLDHHVTPRVAHVSKRHHITYFGHCCLHAVKGHRERFAFGTRGNSCY